jgi:uncharacterized repeat protein (TIGR01451 family)
MPLDVPVDFMDFIERPVDIYASMDVENLTEQYPGVNMPGDVARISVTIDNEGCDEVRADRIQLVDVLPDGMAFVPGSARLVSVDDLGNEIVLPLPRNTSSISSSGHSYNAASGRLEIRLGSFRLFGGESVTVEYDVVIESECAEFVNAATVTAGRASKNSAYNILSSVAMLEECEEYVEEYEYIED